MARLSQPRSLFDTCIQFVAEHVDLVEDFCGFPAQVGEKIWGIVVELPKLYTDLEFSNRALSLFDEAFGNGLLSSLNLSGKC